MAILGAQNTTLREKARAAGSLYHLRKTQTAYNSDLRLYLTINSTILCIISICCCGPTPIRISRFVQFVNNGPRPSSRTEQLV